MVFGNSEGSPCIAQQGALMAGRAKHRMSRVVRAWWVMPVVSAEEIQHLEYLLAQSHARHADRYGPMATCTEPKCLQAKWGIEWLKAQLQAEPGTA
jgi:hypothetical protein